MSYDVSCFFFNDTATTEIYTLSLHDALPICADGPTGNHRPAAGSAGSRSRTPRNRLSGMSRTAPTRAAVSVSDGTRPPLVGDPPSLARDPAEPDPAPAWARRRLPGEVGHSAGGGTGSSSQFQLWWLNSVLLPAASYTTR